MVTLDTLARELERVERCALAGLFRRCDFRGRDTQADLGEIKPVEPGGQLEQGAVAARHHIRDDAAHGLLDVLRSLAFDREKTAKTLRKLRALTVQANGH